MHVLFLTTVLPAERRSGGEIVSQSIIDALGREGAEVRVLGYRRPSGEGWVDHTQRSVGRRPIESATAGPRRFVWMARSLTHHMPYSVAKYHSRAYLRAARRALTEGPAAVVVDHAQVHFAAQHLGPTPPPLLHVAHNAEATMYLGLSRAASGGAGRWVNAREARLIGRVEAGLARRAHQVWTLTPDDAGYFRALVPGADVRTLDVPPSLEPAPPGVAKTFDIALIGTWSWRSNAEGLRWFSRDVVPRLASGLTIEVAGRGAEWLRGRHANVVVRGLVPDARQFLSGARVVAVPAAAGGGGVQVKTLDAVASGAPVVATPRAVRGLAGLPSGVAVATSADDFAAALQRLAGISDPEPLRVEAAAWAEGRRRRLEDDVARWVQEVTR